MSFPDKKKSKSFLNLDEMEQQLLEEKLVGKSEPSWFESLLGPVGQANLQAAREDLSKKMTQIPKAEVKSDIYSMSDIAHPGMKEILIAPQQTSPPIVQDVVNNPKESSVPKRGPQVVAEENKQLFSNPIVAEHVAKKVMGEDYSPERLKELVNQAEEKASNPGLLLAQAFQGFGDALARRNPSQSMDTFDSMRKDIRKNAVDDFERARKVNREQIEQGRVDEVYDPNSERSIAFRKSIETNFPRVAQAYGERWNDIAAQDRDLIFKPLELKEQIDARLQAARLAAEARKDAKLERQEEKIQKLKTPYGLANTEDDAKKLKEAHESKKNFDSKLNEMIELRKQYGGEVFNREAVGRAKQLSKDLLLEYKNMAKLGVLSQSDEKIINAIIPDDPLEFSASKIVGQDPILSNLIAFKADSDNDFNTRVATRTRSGIADYESGKEPQKVESKIRVSNGKEIFEIDPSDLAEAEKDGFKRIK